MKMVRFTLVLSGATEISSELADALYAATEGDIELSMRDGVSLLEFERTGSDLRQAIVNGIRQVEVANIGVRVVRVESDAGSAIAKINAESVARRWPIREDR